MAEKWRNYREDSKGPIGGKVEEGFRICDDQVKLGAILRIADSMETMAKNHQDLVRDRDQYRAYWKEELANKRILLHQIAGLKGHLKKLKKK